MRFFVSARRVALAGSVVIASLLGPPAGGHARAQDAAPTPPASDAVPAAEKPAPDQPSPEKGAATAVDAAKDYTRRMKSDAPATAIRTYWDVEAMLSGIFGDHLRRQSDEERAQMKHMLLTFIENVYGSPAIAAAMKQATFENFREQPGPAAGTTAVAFNVRVEDKTIPNSLHMKTVDGNWKVFDAGTSGKMMVPAIRAQYEPHAQRLSPLDYIKAMVSEGPGPGKKPGGSAGNAAGGARERTGPR